MPKKKRNRKANKRTRSAFRKKPSNRKYRELQEKTKNVLEQTGMSEQEVRFTNLGSDELKMSAVILELVDPLIKKHTKSDQQIEAAISLGILAWNVIVLAQKEAKDGAGDPPEETLIALLAQQGVTEDPVVMRLLIRTIADRKRERFADEQRFILNYDLTVRNGDVNLNVASTVT